MIVHGEQCGCFECFCEKQAGRITARLNRRSKRQQAILGRHRQRIKVTHDEMIVGYHCGALPNLDFYDNR